MLGAPTRGIFLGAFALLLMPLSPAWAQAGCVAARSSGMPNAGMPCGQVEERLRLDPRARRDISPWGAGNTFAPMTDSAIAPAHQRVDGGYGMNAPRLR